MLGSLPIWDQEPVVNSPSEWVAEISSNGKGHVSFGQNFIFKCYWGLVSTKYVITLLKLVDLL